MLVGQPSRRGGVAPAIRWYDVVENRRLRGNVDALAANRREKLVGSDGLVDARVGCAGTAAGIRDLNFAIRFDSAEVFRDRDGRGHKPEDRVVQNGGMARQAFGNARTGALNDRAIHAARTTLNDVAGDELIAPTGGDDRREAP